MLLGVVANPPGHSESEMLAQVIAKLRNVQRVLDASESGRGVAVRYQMDGPTAGRLATDVQESINLCSALARQAQRGVHVNGRGQKMSDHVQAIIYIHAEDGKPYVHGFGDAPIDLQSRGGVLSIAGLQEDRGTDVQMFAESNGSLRIVGRQGQPLWEDHD